MSEKPLAERLQVKKDRRLHLENPPLGFRVEDASSAPLEAAQVALLFVKNRADYEARLLPFRDGTGADAILWLAYPKLTSPLAGDLNRNLLHDLVQEAGLDTVAQIAIDADWSALRLKRL